MYAIVKAGGHQEKVEVGDTILVNRLDAKNGETVEFPVALVVDGEKVIIAAADLAKISVKAEVVNDDAKGPKIRIQKFKNKTGARAIARSCPSSRSQRSPEQADSRYRYRKEQQWHIRRARPARVTVAIRILNTSA